jgi:hypothetical protein
MSIRAGFVSVPAIARDFLKFLRCSGHSHLLAKHSRDITDPKVHRTARRQVLAHQGFSVTAVGDRLDDATIRQPRPWWREIADAL